MKSLDVRDGLGLVGFVAVTVGFWLAWPPLGLIVPGTFLLSCVVFAHMRQPK